MDPLSLPRAPRRVCAKLMIFQAQLRAELLLLSTLIGCSTLASNWPQFRGPQASGLETNAAAPTRWDVNGGDNILWQTPVPGLAHASPILWGDRIYVATAVPSGKADLKLGLYGDVTSANDLVSHQWRLLALDKDTGKIRWDTLGFEGVPRAKRHPKSTHCSSTPATDGSHIVAIFDSEGLFCFDMQGKLLWRKDLGPMDAGYYVMTNAQWGYASSPVIHDGKVVVLCGVLTDPFLAEFNLADGKETWRTPRKDVPTWSTPTVVPVGRQWQILVNGWHQTGAYDFTFGKEIWILDGGGDIPVPTPVVADGLAYLTSAHGPQRPMRAVRLDAQGNITPPGHAATNAAIAWVQARQGNYMQTPIVVAGCVYACMDNGAVTCFDARTGAIHYSERLASGGEGYSSSPVSDGRHIYFASEGGNVFVVPANGKFSVVATNKLGESCMATPALADGVLFYRTRERVIAIGQRGAK